MDGVPAFLRLASHPLRWRLMTELARSDLRVRELVTLVAQPQNLVSYHLRLLRDGGLVSARRSSFDRRDSYYRLDLERCAQAMGDAGLALHPALRMAGSALPRRRLPRLSMAFICTGNSARSPIAEALVRRHAGDQVRVISAGSRPRARLHPDAVRVLRERFDVDVEDQRPRSLESLAGHRFDYVITLCDRAREVCPAFEGRPRLSHWSVAEPADYPACTRVAADIDTRVRHLLLTLPTTDPREVPS